MPDPTTPPFDPYYSWLGIHVEEQPPHHYRLLGLNQFEGDIEVIALAADRQMSHIKSLAGGVHAAESQRLLNELAQARVELLHGEKKQVYDAQLRAQMAAAAPPPPPPSEAPPPAPAESPPSQTLDVTNSASVVRARYHRRRRQKATNPELLLLFAAIGAAIVGAIAFYLHSLSGQ